MPTKRFRVDPMMERLKEVAAGLPFIANIVRDTVVHVNTSEDPTMFGRMKVALPDLVALFVYNNTCGRFSNRMATRIIASTHLHEGDLGRYYEQHTRAAWRFVNYSQYGESRSLTRVHKDNAKLVLWITAVQFLEKEIGVIWKRDAERQVEASG